MKSARSSPTAFRFDPMVKDALSSIAEREGRSMANMIEWLIKQHCVHEGLGWPPASAENASDTQTKTAKTAVKAPKVKKK